MNELVVRIDDPVYEDSMSLYMYRNTPDGKYFVGAELTEKKHEQGARVSPVLRLYEGVPQQLMNELWRIGVRPKDGAGTLAHITAKDAHLADLQKILFHTLKIKETK